MKQRYLMSGCAAIAAGPIAMMLSTTAMAQSTSASNGAAAVQQDSASNSGSGASISDIIVTAERREQNVQRAPLTIQVLSADQLIKSGVTDALSLQRVTNGVQIGANGANTQIFIRGVGSFSAGTLTSPGVAFNVDGVYINQTFGTNGNFYDLARVEILKGPQGTLYGRNATGGSINLITNQPVLGRRSFDLNLEGGNYDLRHASGAVNLPVGDTAALRAAFNVTQRDGYLSDGQNDDVSQSARLRFKWEPSSELSLLLNGDYSHLGGKGGDYVYLPRWPGASPWESATSTAANAYARTFGPLAGLLDPMLPDNRQNTNLYNASAQLDWKLPFATLTLLPAYRRMDVDFATHFTSRLQTRAKIEQSTMEARLGNSSAGLTWVVGGFYYNEKAPSSTMIRSSRILADLANSDIDVKSRSTSYAAFGQATLSLIDGLRLIGGLRYTYERKTLAGTNVNSSTQKLSEAFSGRQTFSNVSYKVGGEFDIAPRSLLYATFSTGYKSGGFSQITAPNTYSPEKLRSIEVGSKNRFFDNRLQVNISGFHWKYRDIQDSRPGFSSVGNLALITFNSGDATIYGGSLEVVARPTAHDTLSLSGEYAHSKYDQFAYLAPAPVFNAASTGCKSSGPYLPGAALPSPANGSTVNNSALPVYHNDCTGFQMARVPKWSGTAGWSHDFDLADGGKVTVDGSVNFSSARWLTIDFIPTERDKAYALVDANLTYMSADKGWSIGLFGRNLTKTAYYSGGIQSGFLTGLVAANIGAPRTYGVRASFRFGQ